MKPIDLLTIVVGVLCLVAIKFAPDQTTLLVATGMFLIGKGLPQGLGNTKTNPSPPSTGATPTVALILGFALGMLALVSSARADSNNPSSGGCAIYQPNLDGTACVPSATVACTCKLSFQASAITPLVVADLKTGDVSVGVQSLGACYGATYAPTKWYASGLDYCFAAKFSQDSPNTLSPLTFMVHLADYGSFGAGPTWTARSGGNDGYWRWMFYMSGRFSIN
jgi:hypothetical protein